MPISGLLLRIIRRFMIEQFNTVTKSRNGATHSRTTNPVPCMQVVQPQEGSKVVACAESRYEFEVFSGTVLGAPKSEAQNAAESLLKRVLGFGKGACQAVHEMVVRAPDGTSRTFRFGTTSADVPAQVLHRPLAA